MNRSRAKGTAWETRIVEALHAAGWPHAERRAQAGNKDRGDIAGLPGVVIEAKSAAKVELAAWLNEAEQERVNARADLAVVWFKRRGYTSAEHGYVLMDGDTLMRLLREAGH